MKKIMHKIITVVMVLAVMAGTVNPVSVAAASKEPVLSKKKIVFKVKKGKKKYTTTLKVKNAKGKKVKWSVKNAVKGSVSIKKLSKYKVKVTLNVLYSGGFVVCKIGKKKLSCDISATCKHNYVAKWTSYNFDEDCPDEYVVCMCGFVFSTEEELSYHQFMVSIAKGVFGKYKGQWGKLYRQIGPHGSKANGRIEIGCTTVINGESDTSNNTTNITTSSTQHITVARQYIDYYECTKCKGRVDNSLCEYW